MRRYFTVALLLAAAPIASLTSVPVQFNDVYDAGTNGDGHRLRINLASGSP
jgi:hypothetical protein